MGVPQGLTYCNFNTLASGVASPEKAGVASSILAPGTIRTYIAQQIPFSAQFVGFPFRRERNLGAVFRQFSLCARHGAC
jgi:hypothetical protein